VRSVPTVYFWKAPYLLSPAPYAGVWERTRSPLLKFGFLDATTVPATPEPRTAGYLSGMKPMRACFASTG